MNQNAIAHKKHLEFVDFSKGLGMLSIVLFHYFTEYDVGWVSKLFVYGGSGIHIFFMASGFGLGLMTKLNLRKFYLRRVVKFLIPYYIALAIILLLNMVVKCQVYPDASNYIILGHYLLYKMFDESIIESLGVHFWFISTIVQFYLIYPILFIVRQKAGLKWFVAACLVVSIIYTTLIVQQGVWEERRWHSSFMVYIWEFSIGMAFAMLYKNGKCKANFIYPLKTLIIQTLVVLLFLGIAYHIKMNFRYGVRFNDYFVSGAYLLAVILGYNFCFYLCKPITKIISSIGCVSYELYLFHMFVFEVVILCLLQSPGVELNKPLILLTITLSLCISIGIAYLFSNIFSRLGCK